MKKLLVLMFIAIFAVGCTSKESSTNPVIAKINTTTITKEDFIKKINRLPEWARNRFQNEEGKKQFLEEVIKEEILYQEAKKKGLNKDKEFQDRVEEFKKMTLIAVLLKKEVEEKAKADTKEVRDFYDKHQDEFKTGLEVRASHVLVSTEAEAKDILKRIQQGENFSKLAEEFTLDKGTAKKGGDLGFFGRGRMVPEFEKVAFSLKAGEVSNPVKSQFGYHIIQVTDRKEGKLRDFEEVKTSVERRLTVEKQRTLFESYIRKLQEDSKIETYEAELEILKIEEAPVTKQ
jgi:peptidyl-prolyl cis-trans isomerase C